MSRPGATDRVGQDRTRTIMTGPHLPGHATRGGEVVTMMTVLHHVRATPAKMIAREKGRQSMVLVM